VDGALLILSFQFVRLNSWGEKRRSRCGGIHSLEEVPEIDETVSTDESLRTRGTFFQFVSLSLSAGVPLLILPLPPIADPVTNILLAKPAPERENASRGPAAATILRT
jgi:hypothetical protein